MKTTGYVITNMAGHVLMSRQIYLFFITIDGMSHLQMLKHGQCKSNTITSTSRYESLVMECKCDINCFVEMSI